MNALIRFWQRGAQDADRRLAAVFSPQHTGAADRYLKSSSLIRGFDRFARVLQVSAASSRTARVALAARAAWDNTDWRERHRTIAFALMVAVGVHFLATALQAQPPDWFRSIVPMMTVTFAVLLLIGSRSPHD